MNLILWEMVRNYNLSAMYSYYVISKLHNTVSNYPRLCLRDMYIKIPCYLIRICFGLYWSFISPLYFIFIILFICVYIYMKFCWNERGLYPPPVLKCDFLQVIFIQLLKSLS